MMQYVGYRVSGLQDGSEPCRITSVRYHNEDGEFTESVLSPSYDPASTYDTAQAGAQVDTNTYGCAHVDKTYTATLSVTCDPEKVPDLKSALQGATYSVDGEFEGIPIIHIEKMDACQCSGFPIAGALGLGHVQTGGVDCDSVDENSTGFEFGIAMYTSQRAPPGNLRIHSPIADKDGNALVTVFKLCADTRCNCYNELLLCGRDAEI